MLRPLADDLWVTERPLRFLGCEIGTRMTVVRLASGDLWLHSPVHLDPGLRKELDALGPVRFAVAPNRFHHLYVGDVATAYPGVEVHVAPGLATRRKDLVFHAELSDDADVPWSGEMDQKHFAPMALLSETVFLHRASRTLVMTDLSMHFGEGPLPFSTRLACALAGRAPGTFGPTRLEKLTIRDRAAGRAALDEILAWDFDCVIVAHGDVLETGGPEALRAGYDWM